MVMRTLSLRIWFRVTGCNRRVRDDAKLCYHASGLIGQLGGETKLLPQVKKTASVLRKIKFMLEEGLFRAFVGAPVRFISDSTEALWAPSDDTTEAFLPCSLASRV